MLERPELLILPWSPPGKLGCEGNTPPSRIRMFVDPVKGIELGFVGWSGAGHSWWRSWRNLTLQVCELPDASLLMTLHRPWGLFRMWQVSDAEERRVGSFQGYYLFDGLGYLFAYAQDEDARSGRFFTRPGSPLGAWQVQPDGSVHLTFTNEAESSPFARMILLGQVLSCHMPT